MLTVSATEFQKNFAKYQDAALVQPVTVTQNGRERIVVLSAETFHQMQRYTREVLPIEALSDTDLAALAAAEPPRGNDHLDRELDQDA
jgi:prevent-host-death family protein